LGRPWRYAQAKVEALEVQENDKALERPLWNLALIAESNNSLLVIDTG